MPLMLDQQGPPTSSHGILLQFGNGAKYPGGPPQNVTHTTNTTVSQV